LESEQEKECQQILEAKQKEEIRLTSRLTAIRESITCLICIDGLKKELSSLAVEAGKLQSDINAFKPDRDRLSLAKKAASLEGPYARLTAGRKQQADDQTALKSEKRDIPKLESSVKKQAELLKSAEQQVSNAKEELKAAAPLIQKVRSLDQRLAEQKKIGTADKESCKKDKARIDATKKARNKEQKKRTDAKKDFSLQMVISKNMHKMSG